MVSVASTQCCCYGTRGDRQYIYEWAWLGSSKAVFIKRSSGPDWVLSVYDSCHTGVEARYRRGEKESKETKYKTILSMKICPVGFLAECSLLGKIPCFSLFGIKLPLGKESLYTFYFHEH